MTWDDEPIKGSMRDYEAQLEGIPAKHFALKASNAVTTQLFIDDLRLGRWEDYDVYDQVCRGYSYRGHGFNLDADSSCRRKACMSSPARRCVRRARWATTASSTCTST